MAKERVAVIGVGQTKHQATRGDVSMAGLVREAASRALFGHGDLASLDEATLEAAFADLPRAAVAPGNGIPPILDLLVASGLSESRGQARRTLAEGGAYVNNARVTDPAAVPDRADLLAGPPASP